MGDFVGALVVGDSVGRAEGIMVGPEVGDFVGAWVVGDSVGRAEGIMVGPEVGDFVGDFDGSEEG